jgi:hypothetical protein
MPAEGSRTALEEALALHGAALGAGATLSEGELARLAKAWDEALADPGVRRWAAERALAIGSLSGGDEALKTLGTLVKQDLGELARDAKLSLVGQTGVLAGAAWGARQKLLAEIESTADRLKGRVESGKELPASDEWREFLALRRMVGRAGDQGGLEVRRLVFDKVHGGLCPLAVKLWNTRGQKPIAHAIFSWLLAEAEAVGNTGLATHERKNVGCGAG